MPSSFERYKAFYVEPFSQFLSEVDSLGDFGYPYGIFFSHPLPEYDIAQKKVFYIGRDTNGWDDYYRMMEQYHHGQVLDYLDDQWPTSAKEMMGWGDTMTFWTVVFKLHIYLNHGVLLPSIYDYSDEQKQCLLGLGFGNKNCVEVKESLQNDRMEDSETGEKTNVWHYIDEDKYWIFKEKSRRFDRLKVILELYEPDLVYILSWPDDFTFTDGVNLIEDQSLRKNYWSYVYSIEGYKTKLIWTSHPSFFARRITRNVNEVVKYLGDTALHL